MKREGQFTPNPPAAGPQAGSPLPLGRTAQRSTRLAATQVQAMLALTGAHAAAGLIEALMASHLLGCAVANATEAAPDHAVITLNHRVICKQAAPADTDIALSSRVRQVAWNHRLKGWVAELDAEARSAQPDHLLMAAESTLLVKPLAPSAPAGA